MPFILHAILFTTFFAFDLQPSLASVTCIAHHGQLYKLWAELLIISSKQIMPLVGQEIYISIRNGKLVQEYRE